MYIIFSFRQKIFSFCQNSSDIKGVKDTRETYYYDWEGTDIYRSDEQPAGAVTLPLVGKWMARGNDDVSSNNIWMPCAYATGTRYRVSPKIAQVCVVWRDQRRNWAHVHLVTHPISHIYPRGEGEKERNINFPSSIHRNNRRPSICSLNVPNNTQISHEYWATW